MPRHTRLIIPNIYHHALHRQDVFHDHNDRFYYLEWARKLAEQNHVPITGYCLMTNHIHLLILPQNTDGLINFMKLLAQRYTQYFNRKYHRSGKLWENRYKLIPFDPETYYVVLKYIEMNPVRAGLVSDGATYPWSSASYHLLGKENQTIMADCLHDSIFSYKRFFYEEEVTEDLEAIRTSAQQGKAWGKPAFLEELANSLDR
ncbi:MAG: transposase, partial [Deltaproteobacteria bacterium]|nr:transposase [Deltaproteobacteria bacterium]